MPYYKGDYYRGDYYRGDPFLGAIVGLAGSALGKAAGRAASYIGRQVAGRGRATISTIARDIIPTTIAGGAGAAIGRRLGPAGGISRIPQIGPGTSPKYFGGGERKRYRRMNPLNPKALKRALRRAEGFEKFARKTVSGLRYGPKKFKSQRRAS